MSRSPTYECIHVRVNKLDILLIALSVDDLLAGCSCRTLLAKIKGNLSTRFEMKNRRESKLILGKKCFVVQATILSLSCNLDILRNW